MAGVLALPLIDLASPDRDSTAKSIRKACADHGFFYLVNHGIEELLSQQVLAESKKFFSLPLDEKMKLQTRKDNRGYNPLLSHTLDSSSEVQGDASEGIFISSAKISHSQFNANQWPPKELLPCWRATMESYYEKMLAICRDKDRRPQLWEDVPHVHGALIVNVGDLLERWTNCLFRSTLHRVLPTEQERYSVAFFLDGDLDCMVECLESCCSKENPPRFPAIRCVDYLQQRISQIYPGGQE